MASAAKHAKELLKEADEFRRKSQVFAAIARLARVELLLKDLPPKGTKGKSKELQTVRFAESEIAAVRDSARDYLQKLTRILSVAGEYTFEELAWIVTLRTELWLVDNFLRAHDYGELGISTAHVDETILELAQDPASAKQLDSADRHVAKHGGVSLVDVGVLMKAL